jgi:micrococcal nuclease
VPVRAHLVLGFLLLYTCGTAPSPCGPATGVVESVVDGDTIHLVGGTKIRFLLVDTPETTQGKNDCFGQEAKAFTKMKLEGKTVSLSYDDATCTDRFKRTLAYIRVDGFDVNAELVKQGFACALYVKPGGEARKDEFDIYESESKTSRVGMWGACSVIPCAK